MALARITSPPIPRSPEFASVHKSQLLTGISFIFPYVLARRRSLESAYASWVHLGVGNERQPDGAEGRTLP